MTINVNEKEEKQTRHLFKLGKTDDNLDDDSSSSGRKTGMDNNDTNIERAIWLRELTITLQRERVTEKECNVCC